jgi:outer membrane protein
MVVKGNLPYLKFLFCLVVCFSFWQPCFAQTGDSEKVSEPLVAVKRIALIDLDGVLRNADANARIREALDEQRAKFQEEFRAVEIDLQQSERDLLSRRDLMAKEEYDKLVAAFQARVAELQKDIQYKRQSIDTAYQKALSSIRTLAIEEVTKIAGEKKIDLILKRDASVIFLPHLNISDELLKRLNERTKDARIEVEINKQNLQ